MPCILADETKDPHTRTRTCQSHICSFFGEPVDGGSSQRALCKCETPSATFLSFQHLSTSPPFPLSRERDEQNVPGTILLSSCVHTLPHLLHACLPFSTHTTTYACFVSVIPLSFPLDSLATLLSRSLSPL